MHRPCLLALAALLVLSACKIEPTPRDYIDRSGPAAEEREAARDELRAFLYAFTNAIDRRDDSAALAALAVAPQAWLIGPDANQPLDRAGFVAAAVHAAREAAPLRYELEPGDLRVAVGPRAAIGWFVVRLAPVVATGEAADSAAAPVPALWMSGVYQRRAGAWELVQAHLSRAAAPAVSAAAAPPSSPAAGPARSE
ncbi:MAG TPA: nuclear transport factor 2 family protein [Longimicrobiaceae bacterium]|nr:nuclear transport factor 2 family protein [Longimicrobiaceae bacterium]